MIIITAGTTIIIITATTTTDLHTIRIMIITEIITQTDLPRFIPPDAARGAILPPQTAIALFQEEKAHQFLRGIIPITAILPSVITMGLAVITVISLIAEITVTEVTILTALSTVTTATIQIMAIMSIV